jgi:hypothetical protein
MASDPHLHVRVARRGPLCDGFVVSHDARCVGIKQAAAGVKTYEFQVPPGMSYKPGQYATFRFQVGGTGC